MTGGQARGDNEQRGGCAMTDKVVVFVTCGTAEQAEHIAQTLVEERLAACVNITNPIRSLYHWEGKLNDDLEVMLMIKTSRALFDKVRRRVEQLHSYQTPEVICLPVIDGAPNYLNWLASSLSPTGRASHPSRPKPVRRLPTKKR